MKGTAAQRIAAAITMALACVPAFSFSALPAQAAIKTPDDKFVRTANYYLRAGTDITPADYPNLANYDLLIFPAEAQIYNQSMFARLRELNPTIIILAYVPSKSFNYSWSDPLHQKLAAGIDPSWWLRDQNGNNVSVWPGTAVLSGVSGWNDYLPHFVKDQIMSTGLWDGVLYDEFSVTASWMNGGNIDVHGDHIRDDAHLLDVAWERGMINLLSTTRTLLGPAAVIVTNGDSTDSIQPFVNGRMFESFPTPWEAGGSWEGVMNNYVRLQKKVGNSPVFIINTNTGNTGQNADYKKVRYGLASTLMADGFFSYDFGESSHGQLWHFDEEDVHLGRPTGAPVNVLAPADARIRNSVWRRDFALGAALVNSSGSPQTVNLGGEMEKVRGSQDPGVNDGSVVTSVTIPANDGLLLLKRLAQVTDAAFPNGAFVRIFENDGSRQRNGFFSYDESEAGAATVVLKDLDGEGTREKISFAAGTATVRWADGRLRATFKPFGDAYKGGATVAVCDLDGDNSSEIVFGAGAGGGPQIRIFNADGRLLNPGFFAYDPAFRGGVNVACGDLYGTGRDVIVAGAGVGGGPHVRVFSKYGKVLNPGWFAYDSRFRGGVNVAVGDLDGDGKAEIVTGPGLGGGPQVRVFSAAGRAIGKGFFAGDPNSRGGIAVAVTDSDGDGKNEIATFTADVFTVAAVR